MEAPLAGGIEAAVRDGVLTPGSRLENEVSLAQRLGLSRPTVRQGIQEVVDKGMLVRKRGDFMHALVGALGHPGHVALRARVDKLAADWRGVEMQAARG